MTLAPGKWADSPQFSEASRSQHKKKVSTKSHGGYDSTSDAAASIWKEQNQEDMKFICLTIVTPALVALGSFNVSAQQPAAGRPAAPATPASSTASPAPAAADGKVGIIDTEAFADPKTGIVRLVRAFQALEREFKPKTEELQKLRAQYDQLVKNIEATRNVDAASAQAIKIDQAETLKKEIERKTQDAQDLSKRRVREVTEPIYKDIGPALQAYARQRGVSVVFDISKMGEVMFIINNNIDLTSGFIADYNQRNPAPAAPAATTTP